MSEVSYNHDIYRSSRLLVGTSDIEVEYSLTGSIGFTKYLRSYVDQCGFPLDYSLPISVYFDRAKGFRPSLYNDAHVTFRDRLGGVGTHGEIFDDIYGLKFRHVEFQHVMNELLEWHSGKLADTLIKPSIRCEIERPHTRPRNPYWTELRFEDLPQEIGDIVASRLGQEEAERLVIAPRFVTVTPRNRIQLVFDPNREEPLALLPLRNPAASDIDRAKAQFMPHNSIRRPGHHICWELAFDESLRYYSTPVGTPIASIFDAQYSNFKGFKRLERRPRSLIEVEFKKKYSGLDITDDDLAKGHLKMVEFLAAADRLSSGRSLNVEHSKATGGYRLLTKLDHRYSKRTNRAAFQQAVVYAA